MCGESMKALSAATPARHASGPGAVRVAIVLYATGCVHHASWSVLHFQLVFWTLLVIMAWLAWRILPGPAVWMAMLLLIVPFALWFGTAFVPAVVALGVAGWMAE